MEELFEILDYQDAFFFRMKENTRETIDKIIEKDYTE